MQFHNFEENLLGSRVTIKIIKRLLSDEAITSEREIARILGISPGASNRVLKGLHNCNLIFPMRIGSAVTWQLNKQSYAYQFLADILEKIKSSPIDELKDDIRKHIVKSKIIRSVKKVIIFGSVINNTEMPNSDIDIFVAVRENRYRNDVSGYLNELSTLIMSKYGNRISLSIFTLKELNETRHKKFLENVLKGSVVLENEN